MDRDRDEWQVEVSAGSAKTDGVARRIVTESMLFGGEAAAAFAEASGIPVPYRIQTMGDVGEDELADWPAGPAGAWAAVRRMQSSRVSVDPRPHEGLGLDTYVQVTSPIRRYPDLAVHYQIKAHLRGDPLPFPAGDGQSQLVSFAREAGTLPRRLERSANAYWLREYLRRNAGRQFSAMVLGPAWEKGVFKLLLPELGALIDLRTSSKLTAGTLMELAPNKNGEFS